MTIDNPSATRDAFFALSSREDVASLLGVSNKHLCIVLYKNKARCHYRTFEIPKKGGGTRAISAPPEQLKHLQRRLNNVLALVFSPRACVHGFRHRRSIVSNASEHCGRRFVFNVDLLDFFPTINFGRVLGVFLGRPYELPLPAATVLSQIACDDPGGLPQGAPTSPIIANLVCRPLDTALQRLAQGHGCFYTRYADDLSFSTNRSSFPRELAIQDEDKVRVGEALAEAIAKQAFAVNPRKVWLRASYERQDVTGLVVNEFPNVSRSLLREMRSIFHNWDKTSLEEAARVYAEKHKPDPTRDAATAFLQFIHGRMAFIKMVRGQHDPVYQRLSMRLSWLDSDFKPRRLRDRGPAPLRGLTKHHSSWQSVFDRLRHCVFVVKAVVKTLDCFGTAFQFKHNLLATAGHNLTSGDFEVIQNLKDNEQADISSYKAQYHDDEIDCGLIRINTTKGMWPEPIWSQERIPEVGEAVAAIGFPQVPRRHTTPILHTGTVSAISLNYPKSIQFIQVSFAQGPGLSGAPLVDRRGLLLGIVVENVFHAPQSLCGGGPDGQAHAATEYGQVIPISLIHELRRVRWRRLCSKA